MRLLRTAPSAATALAIALAAAPALGQTCSNPTDTFWKNDVLPQVLTGSLQISVVPGLCPGESAGCVFTLPAGMPPQKLGKVAIGFGGAQAGKTATVNVEIYNGVTWVGAIPTLGAKIFDGATGGLGNVTVTTTGANEIDVSPFDITVGQTTNKFVVAFKMVSNTNGSCLFGYTSNYFTDAVQSGFPCTPQKNLINILGTGWRDPATYVQSGQALCPTFYAGNWIIRACSEDADICQPTLGFNGPGDALLSVCGDPLSSGNTATLLVQNCPPGASTVLFGSFFLNPTFVPQVGGTLAPFPLQLALGIPADGTGTVTIPGVPGGGGPFGFYLQSFVQNGTLPKGWEVSNAVQLNFLP